MLKSRANLISECLTLIHETDVEVVALYDRHGRKFLLDGVKTGVFRYHLPIEIRKNS